MERTTTRGPRRGGGAKASPAGVAPARTELTVAPAVEVELLVPGEPPEPSFAARVPPPAPERRRLEPQRLQAVRRHGRLRVGLQKFQRS